MESRSLLCTCTRGPKKATRAALFFCTTAVCRSQPVVVTHVCFCPSRNPGLAQKVGIGNGMATAVAFALRHGDHPLYRSSLRSVVSINGYTSVDSQLAAILHSSLNTFATLPATRPDLPVSLMSR